jgi:hypothetical protein
MFKRSPETRRICPVCQKRIDHERARYCNHCGTDFTGTTQGLSAPAAFGPDAAVSMDLRLAQLQGRYVSINLREPQKAEVFLLHAVGKDYITLSWDSKLIHLPMGALITVIERVNEQLQPLPNALPSLVLRHYAAGTGGGSGSWVGFSVPIH